MSLKLPWEVIERAIEHSDDTAALCSFALTCKQLHPRSIMVLFTDVELFTRDQFWLFFDIVKAKPDVRLFVRSITIPPRILAPSLLVTLPQISALALRNMSWEPMRFHPSTLLCCKHFGVNIRTLSIANADFPSPSAFCRVLSAFPNIHRLVCGNVRVEWKDNDASMDLWKERLPRQLKLRTVDADGWGANRLVVLLSQVAASNVTQLSFPVGRDDSDIPDISQWTSLRSITLRVQVATQSVQRTIDILKPLKQAGSSIAVAVDLHLDQIAPAYHALSSDPTLLPELEQILFSLPRSNLTFSLQRHFNVRKDHSWPELLERCFPKLREHQPDAFAFPSSGRSGHDSAVTALVVSADGRWVATGSYDSTIILWDPNDASIIHQWVAYSASVLDLAFSPDSRHLASAGDDSGGVAIWDLTQASSTRSPSRIATLKTGSYVHKCAWSRDGALIMSRDYTTGTRFWDTRTFEERHDVLPLQSSHQDLICISQDFRWLVLRDEGSGVFLWDLTVGEVTISLPNGGWEAEFDRTSTLLAITNSTPPGNAIVPTAVNVWDVEAGEELCVLRGHEAGVRRLAFSSDSRLLLSASEDKTSKVWDVRTGIMLVSLEGHSEDVSTGCFSPCAKYVASGSLDTTVKLWRVSDGRCVATFRERTGWVWRVAFSPNGHMLWSGSGDGTVFGRNVRDIIDPEQACEL